MKKNYLLCASLVLLASLAACDGATNTHSSSSSSSNGNNDNPSIVTPVEEEYVIIARNYVGLTITPSKSKAKAGETITVTVDLEDGYILKKLLLNNSTDKLTKTSNTTYSFTMPNESAVITAELSISGDVVIQGTLAFALSLDESTGIYSARNVTINDTAYLTYVVQGKSLTVTQIDNTKCFADISLRSSSTVGAFAVAGNAKYDFFYDPNNGENPCYIVRTEVLSAPDTAKSFQSLLSGSVRSEATTFPQSVNKVTYSNTQTGDNYVWENYENGSLATSVITDSANNQKTSYVYKSIDNVTDSSKGVYTIVDNYIEGMNGTNDQTKRDDSKAFSGRYDIVANYVDGYKSYQYLEQDATPNENAYFDAHHYSHDINSLDFDIHRGYRTGFDTTYDKTLIDYNVTVSSVTNADGTFTTKVDSFKTIDESKDTQSGGTDKYHYEYDIEFTFTKAGAPLSGTYKQTYYSKESYDVDNKKFFTGGEQLGKIEKQVNFTYSYGEPKKGAIDFDTAPYFLTRLDDLSVNNPTTGQTGNFVQQNDTVNNYLKLKPYPETALDGWQYGIESSSNTSVVGSRSLLEPLTFIAYKAGQTTLTISNHTLNSGIRQTLELNVVSTYKVDGMFLQAYNAYYDEEITASSAYVRAGYQKTAHIYATSRNTGKSASRFAVDITATSSNPELLAVHVNNENQTITFDARNAKVTENTTVKVTCTTDINEPGYNGETFTVTILPYTKPTKSLLGTWTDNQGVELRLQQFENGNDSTYSILKVDSKEYKFKFTFDEESGKLNAVASYGLDSIQLNYDYTVDELGVFAVASGVWTGLDQTSEGEVLCGDYSSYDEEDGGYVVSTYYFLSRAN